MPRKRYTFISIDDVENVLAGQISSYFQDYPEPVPAYQYHGGEYGRGVLESALAEPRQTYGGRYLHRTVFEKAAALWRSITLGHPFLNGNKRMGLLCCHVFLAMNGYFLFAPQSESVAVCVAIADDQPDMDIQKIAEWLRRNTMTTATLERLIQCSQDEPQYFTMVGNAMVGLTRSVEPSE